MGIYDWSIDEDAQKSGDGEETSLLAVVVIDVRWSPPQRSPLTLSWGRRAKAVACIRDAEMSFPRLVTDVVVGVAVSLAFNYMVEKNLLGKLYHLKNTCPSPYNPSLKAP